MLLGQEKLAADVAAVEWIVDTASPLTVSQHPKFRKMMHIMQALSFRVLVSVSELFLIYYSG